MKAGQSIHCQYPVAIFSIVGHLHSGNNYTHYKKTWTLRFLSELRGWGSGSVMFLYVCKCECIFVFAYVCVCVFLCVCRRLSGSEWMKISCVSLFTLFNCLHFLIVNIHFSVLFFFPPSLLVFFYACEWAFEQCGITFQWGCCSSYWLTLLKLIS